MNTIDNFSNISFQARKLQFVLLKDRVLQEKEFPARLREFIEKSPVVDEFLREKPEKKSFLKRMHDKITHSKEEDEILEISFRENINDVGDILIGYFDMAYCCKEGKSKKWYTRILKASATKSAQKQSSPAELQELLIDNFINKFNEIKNLLDFLKRK